jgi:hypothetical protein
MTTTKQKVVLLMMVLALAVVLGGCPVQPGDGAYGAPIQVLYPLPGSNFWDW